MRVMQEQDQRVNMRHSTGARARVLCALLAELLLLSCGNDVVAPENKCSVIVPNGDVVGASVIVGAVFEVINHLHDGTGARGHDVRADRHHEIIGYLVIMPSVGGIAVGRRHPIRRANREWQDIRGLSGIPKGRPVEARRVLPLPG